MTTKTKQQTIFATIELEVAIKTDLSPEEVTAALDPSVADVQSFDITCGDIKHEAEVLLLSNVKLHDLED